MSLTEALNLITLELENNDHPDIAEALKVIAWFVSREINRKS